ncbi:hypothetical protein AAKU64_000082 [Undibacterium sp. GrIS 1.8]
MLLHNADWQVIGQKDKAKDRANNQSVQAIIPTLDVQSPKVFALVRVVKTVSKNSVKKLY